jgi:hypothetical protein
MGLCSKLYILGLIINLYEKNIPTISSPFLCITFFFDYFRKSPMHCRCGGGAKLCDTTLANPMVINSPGEGDNLYFYLTVTDANNMVCKDTVNVRFSRFTSTMAFQVYNLLYGDSVYLSGTNIMGGIPPYTYLRFPNHGLTDSTSLSFWARPNSSISYSVILTDSAGCKAVDADYHRVGVGYVNINEQNTLKAEIYPNPTNDILLYKDGKI